MDINCRDRHAWFSRGKILANLGLWQEALACYDRAIEIHSSYYEAWCEKGVLLEKLGRWQEADTCFNQSLGVFADECLEESLADDRLLAIPGEDKASIYYNKACFHSLHGNLDQAFNNLTKAIKLNPYKYLSMLANDSDLEPLRQNYQLKELIQSTSNLIIQ